LGDLKSFAAVMALLGFFAITAMAARGIRSAVIIGMGVISLIAWFSGQANFVGVIAAPPSMQPVFMQLDIVQALDISMLSIILTLLLVDLFDTAGTLVAVAYPRQDGRCRGQVAPP
jgi:AGZA family xanthine/uracil permease-like MFS transporter